MTDRPAYAARLNYENEIVIQHDGEDRDIVLTPSGPLPAVIEIPASEDWEDEGIEAALREAGWERVTEWSSFDVDGTTTVSPRSMA